MNWPKREIRKGLKRVLKVLKHYGAKLKDCGRRSKMRTRNCWLFGAVIPVIVHKSIQVSCSSAELEKEKELRQVAEKRAQENLGQGSNPAEEDFLELSEKLNLQAEVQQTKYLQEELEIAKQVLIMVDSQIEDLQTKMEEDRVQAFEIQTALKSQLTESEEAITKLKEGSDENKNKDLEDQISAAEKTERDLRDRLVKQVTEAEMERERLEKIIHNVCLISMHPLSGSDQTSASAQEFWRWKWIC
eukprot:767914-Hanusia_phi.AAC.3